MKTYVITTGALFGLVAVVHIWRMVEEGSRLATEPWFVAMTATAAALCLWAVVVARRAPPR